MSQQAKYFPVVLLVEGFLCTLLYACAAISYYYHGITLHLYALILSNILLYSVGSTLATWFLTRVDPEEATFVREEKNILIREALGGVLIGFFVVLAGETSSLGRFLITVFFISSSVTHLMTLPKLIRLVELHFD